MKEITVKKNRKNQVLFVLHVITSLLLAYWFYPFPLDINSTFNLIGLILILTSTIIYMFYVFLDEQCHMCSYASWINFYGNSVIIMTILFSFSVTSIMELIFSIANIAISITLLIFRHEMDEVIGFTLIKHEESFEELDLNDINTRIPLYRIKRTIQRGIRAEYMDPNFIIDRDMLLKCPVLKINKDILYRKMKPLDTINIGGNHFKIYGLALIGMSPLWFLVINFLSYLSHILFGITLAIGLIFTCYFAVQSLHNRKVALVIEHWLRWKKEVDLAKIGKEFGYLPVPYTPDQLLKIVKKFESTGVFGKIRIDKMKLILEE